MSDSDSEAMGWRTTDKNRVSPSPTKEPLKRQNTKDLSGAPDTKKPKKNDAVFEDRVISRTNNDDSLNYMTQPPMLLFKHFLNQQEDNILVEDAMRKYCEYKEAFACQQLQSFFESHKDEEWFMEKYHPDYVETRENQRLQSIENRRRVFMELFEDGWMQNVSVHVSYQDSLGKLLDAVCILLEGGNKNDLKSLEKKIVRSESPDRVEIKMSDKTEAIALNRHDFGNSSADDSDVECMDDKKQTRTKKKVAEVSVEDSVVNVKAEVPEEEAEADVDLERQSHGDEPRPLHKTCSIFLRNIHTSVFRSQIEEMVAHYPGYRRLALQDAMPERKFLRRGWLTFDRNTNIRNVRWDLSQVRLGDMELGAVVNPEIGQRVRPVSSLTNHRAVMRQDVKYAAKLVARFDKRRRLWLADDGVAATTTTMAAAVGNPLLRNITEHLVDEGSYEEQAYLGGDMTRDLALTGGEDPSSIPVEEDRALAAVVDRLVLYLRIVHSYDYYAVAEYAAEDAMPSKCGLVHARGCLRHPDQRCRQADLEDHLRVTGSLTELVLDSIDSLDVSVAARLGVKSVEDAVDRFLAENTKELSAEKWLCPLSGKKFKGPEFVHKHIANKYGDRIDNVRQTVQFFNNYILDPRRPQLPEHASNRPRRPSDRGPPLASTSLTRLGLMMPSTAAGDDRHRRGGGGSPRDGGGPPRMNNGGNNYYRKNTAGGGGGGGDFDTRNNGGSYYSRKILNYNDVADCL